MRNIIRLIIRFQNVFLFLLLEAIAFVIIFNNNPYHRSTFLNSGNALAGTINEHTRTITDYFQLRNDNEMLSAENAALKNLLFAQTDTSLSYVNDSMPQDEFYFIPVHVVGNSISRRMNYLTIDRGSSDGVKPEMGVVSPKGLVGLVKGTSRHYSVVTPILNTQLFVSAMVGTSGHFGSLNWDGKDYRFAKLKAIENHVNIQKGDTVFTSGYGSIFPKGIIIGFIEDYAVKADDDFYDIDVRLGVNFKSVYFANVVGNRYKEEIDSLEIFMESDD